MSEKISENLKKDNIFGTFMRYSIPCVIGMFFTSFITVVDGIFIGWKVGEKGLAAVNLTLPVLYFLLGITIMVGVGGLTLAMQSLGEKNNVKGNERFTFTIALNAAVNIIIILVLGVFRENVFGLLNAKGLLYPYVKDYLGTMVYFYIFMMMNITLSMFVRGEGRPQLSLVFGLIANIWNIILDYLLVIRFDYGMKGAALASGISVIIAFMLSAAYFMTGKSIFKFTRIEFDSADLKSIIFNGSSEFIGQIAICITTYLFNWVIMKMIGVSGIAAFTIIGYISLIQYMIITGIAQGIHPLISYSFGAKDSDSILKLLSIGIKAVLAVGAAAFILSFAASEGIIRVFAHGNLELISIAKWGLKLYSVSFLLNGVNVIASAYFTSLNDAKTSALISLLRSIVLVSIFLFTLPYFFADSGIWLTIPVTEAVTLIISYIFIIRSKISLSFAQTTSRHSTI